MSTLHLPVPTRTNQRTTSALSLLGGGWTALARLLSQRQMPRTATEEAREVREMAAEVQRNDPRFAADLFAAADRHERLYG